MKNKQPSVSLGKMKGALMLAKIAVNLQMSEMYLDEVIKQLEEELKNG